MTRIPAAMWRRIKERDGGCYHCGRLDEYSVPGHRAGAGMGGSKSLVRNYSNVVVMCSALNQALEQSDTPRPFMDMARSMGWKIDRNGIDGPDEIPITDQFGRSWWLLDDGTRRPVSDIQAWTTHEVSKETRK